MFTLVVDSTWCWGKGFHNGDEQEHIISEAMHKITDLSQDNIQNTKNYVKNPNREKITESLANPLLMRDYRENKKSSQPFFSIAPTASLNPNYCASSFIEKN